MGFDGVADDPSSSIALSHRAGLHQLRAVTALVANNTGLSDLLTALNNITDNTTTKATEHDEFLRSNDLLLGHHFDESTLPFPVIPQHDSSIYASEPNKSSTQPPQQLVASAGLDGLATEATLRLPPQSEMPIARDGRGLGAATSPQVDQRSELGNYASLDSYRTGDGGVSPALVAPPSAEDQANSSVATNTQLDKLSPERPAKTVHLPPQDVQEERLRERREAEDEARSQSNRPGHLHAEAASSPSSTIGAYSATTPMPPQDSPDTSPDSDTVNDEMLPPPKNPRLSSEEQREQDEHDRLLEAQKNIARQEAFGGLTPDDQLNLEARAAAARDEQERQACEAVNGAEANTGDRYYTTEAQQVMDEVEQDHIASSQLPITPAPSHDGKASTVASKSVQAPRAAALVEDEDNITVTPRTKLPLIKTTSLDKARQPDSSGSCTAATKDKEGSDNIRNIDRDPAIHQDQWSSKTTTSPEFVSPMTVRHPCDEPSITALPATTAQTPSRTVRSSANNTNCALRSLRDLASLKGAAEDEDRDYLEPLFRIQAHDSPNSQSKPLPELVKSAQKYLTTEDQFTTLHERMDYRILRRIYQLQNANKWSLRQMEKVAEPETPITHMDHLMAEMKWMRKDFKGERRMKRSVCAWLAKRCADWVSAPQEERRAMQVNTRPPTRIDNVAAGKEVPELEQSGDSAPEDELPPTPTDQTSLPRNLVVAPELREIVCGLQKTGQLGKALYCLPVVGLSEQTSRSEQPRLDEVSKFVTGKLLPSSICAPRKRSRYDYEDEAETLDDEPEAKRKAAGETLAPEDQDVALFHPDNKHIRERLHANNAFRPPSEFVMPGTSFYEFRNGSQWIWEDDQKLRKLAKEYTFNWSMIADEMALPTRYKSSAERRTPWECFERWVELESLPAEMKKTIYFKTWYQRLDQSQAAADRRYQAQVASLQAQSQAGTQVHVPQRRRTVPTRVEKRKSTRYLWLVDAMRKLAKKRENNAYKQAEAQRAAAQRKSANEGNPHQQIGPRMTPQQFSQRRQDRDIQIAEAQRQHRHKIMEAQQRQIMQARAAHQQGAPVQQRPGTANMPPQQTSMQQPNGQSHPNMNGQFPQQARPPLPMATRNGHLAVPQVNAQGIPQAQMQPSAHMTPQQQQQYARMAHANAQRTAQYATQPYQMTPGGQMASPGGNMTTAQQLQQNQAMLQLAQQQQQQHAHSQSAPQSNGHQQVSNAPSMPPPPNPHCQTQQPGQLSSGHVPALIAIKNNIRAKHPHLSEDQLTRAATDTLRDQSASATHSTNQARQNAMNAAAGIAAQATPQASNNMQQPYSHNQQAFQSNAQLPNPNATYMNGDTSAQAQAMNGQTHSPQAAAAYANQIRQRQQAQMLRMHGSPNGTHAQLNGSPAMAHASPNMAPASPSMAYAGMANGQMGQGVRPPSRNAAGTPGGLQRMSSNNSVPGVAMAAGMQNGVQSPSSLAQGSPRNMQASMAR
ncbi:hypothetical protein LTR62_000649 [Meristemomyces frigidus]|uniref:Vacuolar import and degradation protein 21 n=1 Tax=Meristemomyces frigidus TaxID=1508187 RepID=A0AAN7YGR9_9PEZI|nr:hypothetical protein LTR62_000649 [Meristemomyces frigidus]